MSEPVLPPLRSTHLWRAPAGTWGYDRWDGDGRPVIMLPAVMFDRVMWWPAAAELCSGATVVAVDLPGHGASAPRVCYPPEELVDDLAGLIRDLGATQAPVVVGHASAAPLAVLFAARYATHAVVTVDAAEGRRAPLTVAAYLDDMRLGAVPAPYRDMIMPSEDSDLLRGYAQCIHLEPPVTTAARTERLAIHSQAPATALDQWRQEIYHVPGRFAHLADIARFTGDIRKLL